MFAKQLYTKIMISVKSSQEKEKCAVNMADRHGLKIKETVNKTCLMSTAQCPVH